MYVCYSYLQPAGEVYAMLIVSVSVCVCVCVCVGIMQTVVCGFQ